MKSIIDIVYFTGLATKYPNQFARPLMKMAIRFLSLIIYCVGIYILIRQ